jgi:hypothetical protein
MRLLLNFKNDTKSQFNETSPVINLVVIRRRGDSLL